MGHYEKILGFSVLVLSCFQLSSCVDLKQLFTPGNEELIQIIKEELDLFRVDMTKSFMDAHTRRRRAVTGHFKDITIKEDGISLEQTVDSVGPFSTFVFEGVPYLIQSSGIFRLDGLSALGTNKVLSRNEALTQVGSWKLQSNELVLHGYEWKHLYFLLTTDGQFSTIYTMHTSSLQPVFRQRILNKDNAVAARFFDYRRNLYLAICNDNEQHSTTFSSISRWAGSYMDKIHQIQTTGASAVEAFTINSKKYIAIAQTRDSTGDTLMGTLVLKMDHMERLDKFQLLWSNKASSLQYMTTEKEHFLLIGQENEPSIVYWFGGMDFIFWQQFDGLQGKNLMMDCLQLSADEPRLLASDGDSLRFYTRTVSATQITATWTESSFVKVASPSSSVKITQTRFLQVGENTIYLAVTRKSPSSKMESLKIYPVNFADKKPIESRTKETGDKLSECLQGLSSSLQEAKPALERIRTESVKILTTDTDLTFEGTLASEKIVKLDPSKSKVASAQISPEMQRAGSSERFKTAPSQLLSGIDDQIMMLDQMKAELQNVFYKSKPNQVQGKLTFSNGLQFDNLQLGSTDVTTSNLNNIAWSDIQNNALKVSSSKPQEVTGTWTIESLTTEDATVLNTNSQLAPDGFIRTSCTKQDIQAIMGVHQFEKSLTVDNNIQLGLSTTVNNIPFSHIVMKDDMQRQISGYKHAPHIKGDFVVDNVNDVHLPTWFSSVAKINSPTVQKFTGPVKIAENAALQIDQLKVVKLNTKTWDDFVANTMIDGVNQEVNGPVSFENLRVDNLQSRSINGVQSKNFLTSLTKQRITSEFSVETLTVTGPLTSASINGIHLTDAVSRTAKNVEISGPVELENFQVKDVTLPDGITIAEKDVSTLVDRKKVHMYTTVDGSTIFIKDVTVNEIQDTASLNGQLISDFATKYWSKAGNNVVDAPQLLISNRKSTLREGLITHSLNGFRFPNEFISLDQSRILLKAPVSFDKPVTVLGNVTMDEGKTIQKIDMSRINSMMVDKDFTGVIRGLKIFDRQVVAQEGATFGTLNGMDPVNDVVMLTTEESQVIDGIVKFTQPVELEDLHVDNGDVQVNGLVNNLNLEQVKTSTAYKDQENFIDGKVVFMKNINADKFSTVKLNEITAREITDNLIFLKHTDEQTIQGEILLANGRAELFGDSSTQIINGIPVSEHLSKVVMMDSPNLLISGTKEFTDVVLKDQLQCTSINGVNLEELARNAFSKSKSQFINGKWSLENVKFNENLETHQIGGVSLEDVVFTNQPTVEILSPVNFTSTRTTLQGPLTVVGDLNGVKFHEDMKNFININGGRKFDDVSITGDLTWTNDLPEMERLSYLFGNAVTNTNAQKILGGVHLAGGFSSSEIVSPDQWLNDINLQAIMDDALMKDDTNWVISGNNKFTKSLQIGNLVKPVDTLSTNLVNGLNLEMINEDIVKTTDDQSGRVIKGAKTFKGGIHANDLEIKDKLSDFSMQDFVVKDDSREINHVNFKNLLVSGNIDVTKTSGLDLQNLLEDRVSLTKPQELHGSYVFQNVNVEDKAQCQLQQINSISLENTLKAGSQEISNIGGEKVFKNGITVNGQIETSSLNDHNIQNLVDSTFRFDRKEVIQQPVIFESSVTINEQVEMESINKIHIESFSQSISSRIGRLVDEAKGPDFLLTVLSSQSTKLRRLTQQQPSWLEHFRLKQDWSMLGPKSRIAQMKSTTTGEIMVTLLQESDGQNVGLPKGCDCNTVDTVIIKEMNSKLTMRVGGDKCLQVFHATSPSGKAYTVTSDTSSSNTTCIAEKEKGITQIFSEDVLLEKMSTGHVSDLGVFSDRGTDFLILAQYFNKDTRSHTTTTSVFQVDHDGKVINVQNIETHGARQVAVSEINESWMLAIANSKNNIDEESCNADSAIYTWSSSEKRFLLLRTIMTDGAFDVEFITAKTNNPFYKESFVAFAQEGNSASGEVIIYRYEQLGGNFVMSQTLRSNWPITALRSTCICSKCFFITVVPQEGITFYENRFVEGFQEYHRVAVFGATDINSFTLNKLQLFAIATNKGPVLAEAVLAGSCQEEMFM
ncbi:Thrombospondin-type laminin G domain and EAR repeat-containing protein [Orchesella cincta]|uniref:Thrombospondin-type laminin G domain and EAR repeat-containing protein n=1 Tax=Orchesella cincta TaxID=48709 RepID=A0A1D2MXM1_ORCCI|nr:Thrombospondin-type laminin G domain and EAR repeat-containing protein [Orchesella cincta]